MDVHGICCAHPVRALRLLAIIAALLLASAGYGQMGFGSRFDVRGEVQNSPPGSSVRVELERLDGSDMPTSADVSGSGRFEFDSVRAGDYMLRLTDLYGNTIYERPVTVSGSFDDLTIRLPQQKVERPVSGTVSVRELRRQQKVDPKAMKEYDEGVKDFQNRKFDKSIVHFQKAIGIDPSFANAHNELGAAFASLNQIDKAAAEFRKASQLDPDSAFVVSNLALMMLKSERYLDAEAAARAALRADPGFIEAHFLLGYSLYKQHRNDLESIENLRWAGNQYPKAHLLAAEILTGLARKSEAADELRKYLESRDTGVDRHQVESWLSALTDDGEAKNLARTGTAAR